MTLPQFRALQRRARWYSARRSAAPLPATPLLDRALMAFIVACVLGVQVLAVVMALGWLP